MQIVEKLEDQIGEINSPFVRNSIESVLTRLVSVGLSPEESLYLVAKVWDLAIEDGYTNDF